MFLLYRNVKKSDNAALVFPFETKLWQLEFFLLYTHTKKRIRSFDSFVSDKTNSSPDKSRDETLLTPLSIENG